MKSGWIYDEMKESDHDSLFGMFQEKIVIKLLNDIESRMKNQEFQPEIPIYKSQLEESFLQAGSEIFHHLVSMPDEKYFANIELFNVSSPRIILQKLANNYKESVV